MQAIMLWLSGLRCFDPQPAPASFGCRISEVSHWKSVRSQLETEIRVRSARAIVWNKYGEVDYLCELPVPFIVTRVTFDEAGEPNDVEYVYVNEAAADLEGKPREDLMGRSFEEICPRTKADLLDILAETASSGVKQYFTRFNPLKDRFYSIKTYCPARGYCACVLQDVTEEARLERRLKEEHRRLEQLATCDPLTGLLHVRQGRCLVEEALEKPRWPEAKAALFMFDVDDFKKVNDEHGHHCGDLVLKEFAELLNRSFRRSDVVFRAGGDEFSAFAIDLPCSCVAKRICADVIAGVEQLSEECVEVSVSVGVAFGSASRSFEEFYRAADQALYGIKRTGKSSFRINDLDDPVSCDVLGPSFKEAAGRKASKRIEKPIESPAA